LRAKQKALEKRFGTYEASQSNLSRVLDVLKETYPGTYAFRESEEVGNGRDFIVPFSIGPHIVSFTHCQPLLCVDGTFLIYKY
jgi:hypothetical protein